MAPHINKWKSSIWAKYATGRVKTWDISTLKVFVSLADEDFWGQNVLDFYSSCCVFSSYYWLLFICWCKQWASTASPHINLHTLLAEYSSLPTGRGFLSSALWQSATSPRRSDCRRKHESALMSRCAHHTRDVNLSDDGGAAAHLTDTKCVECMQWVWRIYRAWTHYYSYAFTFELSGQARYIPFAECSDGGCRCDSQHLLLLNSPPSCSLPFSFEPALVVSHQVWVWSSDSCLRRSKSREWTSVWRARHSRPFYPSQGNPLSAVSRGFSLLLSGSQTALAVRVHPSRCSMDPRPVISSELSGSFNSVRILCHIKRRLVAFSLHSVHGNVNFFRNYVQSHLQDKLRAKRPQDLERWDRWRHVLSCVESIECWLQPVCQ